MWSCDQYGGNLSERFKLKKRRNRENKKGIWVISAVNQIKFITSDDETAKFDINKVDFGGRKVEA